METPPPQPRAGSIAPPTATEASDRRCVAAAVEVLTAMLPSWKTSASATVTSAPADADAGASLSTAFSGPGPGPWWAVLRRLLSAGLGGRLLPGGGGTPASAAAPPPPLPRDTIEAALAALGSVLDAYFGLLPLVTELVVRATRATSCQTIRDA